MASSGHHQGPADTKRLMSRATRHSLLLAFLCGTLPLVVGCKQESIGDKIDRARQQTEAAAQQPSDPRITSDNAADFLPIIHDEHIEFDYGRAWTEISEYGFTTVLELLAATDDEEYAGAGLSFYCAEDAGIPNAWLVLRLYQWDPVSDTSAYATFADRPEGRVEAKLGTAANARWLSWNLQWAGDHIELADATNFLREAKRHNVLRIRVPLSGRTAEATFRLWPGLNTMIQPNLDWCGLY